jgi:hypothetical protein
MAKLFAYVLITRRPAAREIDAGRHNAVEGIDAVPASDNGGVKIKHDSCRASCLASRTQLSGSSNPDATNNGVCSAAARDSDMADKNNNTTPRDALHAKMLRLDEQLEACRADVGSAQRRRASNRRDCATHGGEGAGLSGARPQHDAAGHEQGAYGGETEATPASRP